MLTLHRYYACGGSRVCNVCSKQYTCKILRRDMGFANRFSLHKGAYIDRIINTVNKHPILYNFNEKGSKN